MDGDFSSSWEYQFVQDISENIKVCLAFVLCETKAENVSSLSQTEQSQ